ncbi:hypothetical protein D9C73_022098 [Collichthys lucidus]|uniref:Uncharacterized protein n=1 Tax=Collichthys lucidus TaxID=240159 RepID=A0A4U5VI25_COLLU|nr:hypothetical protein D9C73_022098 [Collichthys lucidus]
MVRVELEWEIPMSVMLPIQVQTDPVHQPFPFLDTTLADLGIEESEVKERVVWVDTKKTQVKNKAGKLKEKEITILEVRVKAQKPGDKQLQEVLYSTEAHTDRSFCRTGMDILPWKHRSTGENGPTPVQMTMVLPDCTAGPGTTGDLRSNKDLTITSPPQSAALNSILIPPMQDAVETVLAPTETGLLQVKSSASSRRLSCCKH